jgi:dephospho-CoA kinase
MSDKGEWLRRENYMPCKCKKPVIGLVGAVGSGKSTVADEFGKLGCGVVKADVLNHQILQEKDVVAQVVVWWGDKVLDGSGGISRDKLGEVVFDDPGELAKLTKLVHPRILELQRLMVQEYMANPAVKAVVLDVPLLVEVGWDRQCDCLVYVWAEDRIRRARLAEKRGWGLEKIKKIENLQIVLDKKAKMSEYVVSNSSDIPDLALQVVKIFSLVLQKFG